jgi:hypothetical protein
MLNLYPQQTRHVSLCEALDRLLNTGVVALGELTISVAEVDLIYLGLQLVVTSIETGRPLNPGGGAGPRQAPKDRLISPTLSIAAPTSCPVNKSASLPLLSPPSGSDCLPAPSDTGYRLDPAPRQNPTHNKKKNGLEQLVLTLMKLVHELLERQALRRSDAGSLSADELERLGVALMRQAQEIERLRKEFGLEEEDLNLDLGPLGKLM